MNQTVHSDGLRQLLGERDGGRQADQLGELSVVCSDVKNRFDEKRPHRKLFVCLGGGEEK